MIPIFIGGEEIAQGEYKERADILQFSDSEEEDKWTKVGEMSKPRNNHAVSIVDMNDFKNHCQ